MKMRLLDASLDSYWMVHFLSDFFSWWRLLLKLKKLIDCNCFVLSILEMMMVLMTEQEATTSRLMMRGLRRHFSRTLIMLCLPTDDSENWLERQKRRKILLTLTSEMKQRVAVVLSSLSSWLKKMRGQEKILAKQCLEQETSDSGRQVCSRQKIQEPTL